MTLENCLLHEDSIQKIERVQRMDMKLLELVVCPITHSKLRVDGDELVSEIGEIRYPIRDGLPVLLPGRSAAA